MILAQINQKMSQLQQVFSWIQFAQNPELVNDSINIINQFEAEKLNDFNQIELIYSPETKVIRYWVKEKASKATPCYHKQKGEWLKGSGDLSRWLPYRNQDIKYLSEGQIAIIHEGEKACNYARSVGLVSFAFMGAKSQDEEFLETQLNWLKGTGLKGAIYFEDNDKQGIEKGLKLLKVADKIDFPLISINLEELLYPCNKGDDFADLVIELRKRYKFLSPEKQNQEIIRYLTQCLEERLDEFINSNFERLSKIKFSVAEIKTQLETLFQSDLPEDELIIESEELYGRLETPMSKTNWGKLIKAIKSKYRHERIKFEIQRYLQEGDRLKQIDIKNQVCCNYGYSSKDFYDLVAYIDDLERTPYKQIWNIKDLIDHAQNQERWILPSFLPMGELLLLTAAPKVGKSLLATEITNKVLTGGEFLGEQVDKGSVLYCFSDESPRDFGNRIFNLGLDLPEVLPNQNALIGLSYFDILKLKELEKWLEDYRPSLVVFDSLTSISQKLGVSENDPQFAQHIYRLKDVLKKYNCSGILIHHDNKAGEVSGSLRIEAAVWGSAQLCNEQGTIANDEENLENQANWDNVWSEDYRILKLKRARSTEPNSWKLFLNPTQQWIDKGIYEFCGEVDDKNGQKREAVEKLAKFLQNNCDVWLEVEEINHYLGVPSSTLYRALSKLERTSKVKKRRSTSNYKKWVYQWSQKKSNNYLQQVEITVSGNLDNQKIQNLITPPPENENKNENENAKTFTEQSIPSFSRSFSPKKVDENENENENEVRMSEPVDNKEVQGFDSHSHDKTRGGG
jgi:predicted transcriptional regulator